MHSLTILLSGYVPGPHWGGMFQIIFFSIIGCFYVIPMIFFIITLQNALLAVSPHNRKMLPGKVWLILIPIFNLVWFFIVVGNIADSFKAEFMERNLPRSEARPSYGNGLATAILQVCCPFASPLFFVCWIIYWVKVARLKNELLYTKGGNSY